MGKIKETKEGWNMDIFDFLTMLGGLSLFLFGMSLMGARDSLPLLMEVAVAYERAARVNEGLHPYDAVEEEAQA